MASLVTYQDPAIQQLAGLQSLELPLVADDWLAKICPQARGAPPVTQRPSSGKAGNLVGTWRTTLQPGNLTMTFSANGTFAGVAVNQDGRQAAHQGTYRYANGVLSTNSNQGAMQGTVTWIDANRF